MFLAGSAALGHAEAIALSTAARRLLPPFVEVNGIMTGGIRDLPYPEHPVVQMSPRVDSRVRVRVITPQLANQSVPDPEGG